MYKLVIVGKEGNVDFGRVGHVSHHDDFIEFGLILFKDIDVFCYFFMIVLLILVFEIDISICVDIVKYGAYFGKRWQYLGHQNFWLITYLLSLEFLDGGLFDLLMIDLLGFIFLFKMPYFKHDLSIRRIIEF